MTIRNATAEDKLVNETLYDIEELVTAVDKLIRKLKSTYDGIKELRKSRNIHYYVQQGLIEAPTHRGKLTVYEEHALYGLVFVRIVQAVTPLGLREINDYMQDLSKPQIKRVATGEELFHFRVQRTQRSKPKSIAVAEPRADSKNTEEFGRLSASFASMAKQFAETAAEFAEIAESYSEKDKKK